MEARGADHAAGEVLATTATPEPAPGVPQVSSQAVQEPEASGEGEQARHAPAATHDDDLFGTPIPGRRLSSSPEAAAATKKMKLAGPQGSPAFTKDMDADFLPQGGAEGGSKTASSDSSGRPSVRLTEATDSSSGSGEPCPNPSDQEGVDGVSLGGSIDSQGSVLLGRTASGPGSLLGAAMQAQEQAAATEEMQRAINAQRADFDGRLADQASAQRETAAAVQDMQRASAAMMTMMQGMMTQFAALSGIVQQEKRSTPDVDADTEAEREQDAQADSRNEEDAVSGCPHPAASVPTGQVDGSTPAAGHEDLLGSDGGASETVIEQNLEPGPENAVEEWLNEAARASADSSTSSSGDYSQAGTNQTLRSVQDSLGSRDSVSASGQQ